MFLNRLKSLRSNVRRTVVAVVVAAAAIGAAPVADSDAASFEALRAADLRLATIGHRLATANAALCAERQPATGLVLHAIDQYRGDAQAAARAHFGFARPLGVMAVVPGSAGQRAGLRADDALASLAGVEAMKITGDAANHPETHRLLAAHRLIASQSPDAPVALSVERAGRAIALTLAAQPACRTRFELAVSDRVEARADGEMVQISTRALADNRADADLAALVAHELAHNILRHRARLDVAGVSRGLFAGVGGSGDRFRQSEIEADLLSVHLVANAGFAPAGVADFWSRFGRANTGLIQPGTHPGWRHRVAATRAEAAYIAKGQGAARVRTLVAWRDRPLDGNWRETAGLR
ncbi:peptidase M48 family protein [Sphingomonas baiyangensis]|uniref:Peptidase M48 family protein n=1 Tax=Sphingomonas baiyangensis TaxID=2572576 RepID=A0A4U1KZZ1_9SPHN|nr:peptidase M48 family protein [Sphingomonas baiyangensis]TKD50009.1 peptidase M48 family protein [Sphingomonas baiyangensis]